MDLLATKLFLKMFNKLLPFNNNVAYIEVYLLTLSVELIFSNASVITDRPLMISWSEFEDGIRDGLLMLINSSTISPTIVLLSSLVRLPLLIIVN